MLTSIISISPCLAFSEVFSSIKDEFMYSDKTGTFLDNQKIELNINTEIHNSTGSISTKYWEEDKKAKRQ